MKRILLFLFPMFLACSLYAGGQIENYSEITQTPVYFPQTTNCISIYNIGGGTQTSSSAAVWVSSMDLVTADGLNPGTTNVTFSMANSDTVGEFITFVNALDQSTCPGVGAGWVAILSQGSYEGNVSASMTVVALSTCNTSAYPLQLTIDAVLGMSYVIPAPTNGDSIYLTDAVVNATYGSGSLNFNVYDGVTTDTQIRKETGGATTVDKSINIPVDYFKGSPNTAMRLDLVGTAAISSAYINFTYKKRR